MNEKKMNGIKLLFNDNKVLKISKIDESYVFDFENDIRLFINKSSSGVDFSLTAMTEKSGSND